MYLRIPKSVWRASDAPDASSARRAVRLSTRDNFLPCERHGYIGYTCRGCGVVPLWCYDVLSVLSYYSRNTCSAAVIIAAVYNVNAAKHARQEGFGEVYQVPCAEGCPDHSAVEIRPESQHYVQTGLVSWRLGKSKVCFSPYNLSGFTLLIFDLIFFIYLFLSLSCGPKC